jgi:O-antigen/teichoic acid export membrane protein
MFGLPDIPVRIGAWALRLADRLVLQAYVSLSAIGVYSVGYMLGTSMFEIITNAINSAVLPFFYGTATERSEGDAKRIFSRVSCWNTALIGALALATSLFARETILVLTTRQYLDAVPIVPLVAWASAFQALSQVPSRGIYLARRTAVLPIVFAVPAVVKIALTIALVPWLGIVGAAWATLIAYPLLFVLSVIFGQRAYYIPYDWRRMAVALGAALALTCARPFVETDGLVTSIALKMLLFVAYPAVLLAFGFVLPAERVAMQRAVSRWVKGRRAVTSVS